MTLEAVMRAYFEADRAYRFRPNECALFLFLVGRWQEGLPLTPTLDDMGEALGVSSWNTVKKARGRLTEAGLITFTEGNGRSHPTTYHFTAGPEKGVKIETFTAEKGVNGDTFTAPVTGIKVSNDGEKVSNLTPSTQKGVNGVTPLADGQKAHVHAGAPLSYPVLSGPEGSASPSAGAAPPPPPEDLFRNDQDRQDFALIVSTITQTVVSRPGYNDPHFIQHESIKCYNKGRLNGWAFPRDVEAVRAWARRLNERDLNTWRNGIPSHYTAAPGVKAATKGGPGEKLSGPSVKF